MSPITDPHDEELLAAIARHGRREHVLRHLEAANAMGELDALDVAAEHNVENESADIIAKQFVTSWDSYVEDSMSDESYSQWRSSVEELYGDEANHWIGTDSSLLSSFINRLRTVFSS